VGNQSIIFDCANTETAQCSLLLWSSRPIYECIAAYGHFGRTPGVADGFSWEKQI